MGAAAGARNTAALPQRAHNVNMTCPSEVSNIRPPLTQPLPTNVSVTANQRMTRPALLTHPSVGLCYIRLTHQLCRQPRTSAPEIREQPFQMAQARLLLRVQARPGNAHLPSFLSRVPSVARPTKNTRSDSRVPHTIHIRPKRRCLESHRCLTRTRRLSWIGGRCHESAHSKRHLATKTSQFLLAWNTRGASQNSSSSY